MEVLLFLGILILIIMHFSAQNRMAEKIANLSAKMDALRADLRNTREVKTPQSESLKKEAAIVPKAIVTEVKKPEHETIIPPKQEVKPVNIAPVIQNPIPVAKPKEVKASPSFFEQHPDMEKFIGENLINKIGIGILVIGIGFFVKYAIDQNWIHAIGRAFIGILCGALLIGFAHKLRKEFKAFSSVLVGGGLAIFYFTITIAFHEYHLLDQTPAFIIMVIITGFSVLLSIAYDRKELAVLAIIGGFASPFMVSTGEGNYIILFSYILILNLGMLTLAYFKKWNLLNIISYIFTIILYGGWLITKVEDNPNAPYMGAFIFATLFYFVFFLMNIINNIKENRKFIATEISILLSNTFLYYSAGMIILDNVQDGAFKGLFTAIIAVFNFGFAFILYKNKKADTNLVYLLIGLVLTFISLAAPIQLEGNYITLFWAMESVLLLWLSQKSGIKIIKLASVIIMGLGWISLLMDWGNIYQQAEPLTIIFNKGFITSLVSISSVYITIHLLKNEGNELAEYIKMYKQLLSWTFIILIYVSGLHELNFQLNTYIEPYSLRTLVIGSYNFIFILGLMFLVLKKGSPQLNIAATILGIAGTLGFISFYHLQILYLRDQYIYHDLASLKSFMYHYIVTGLAIAVLFFCHKNITSLFGNKSNAYRTYLWYISFVLVFIFSAELDHIVLLSNYSPGLSGGHIISQNHKIGFPILWGICSFIFISIGMKNKIKDLRIISLFLFFITLLKLFIFDLKDISEGGKIAAFICLGILLLVVSFMYQRLKKLVLEDESKPVSKI